jgi:phytoene/squalene synthetase
MLSSFQSAQAALPLPAQQGGSAFRMALRLLPASQRAAMFHIYALCRAVDDIADGDAAPRDKRAALERWRDRIDACYAGMPPPAMRDMAHHVADFGLARTDFHALIDGMLMDAQDHPLCAPAASTLDLYCDRGAAVRAPRLMGATYRRLLARLARRGWHSPRAAVRLGTLERIGILLRHGMG